MCGESGAGKQTIAALVQCLSSRRHQPLLHLDCAALPVEALEVELFGAITPSPLPAHGAAAAPEPRLRQGCLQMAGDGAVVLHQIAALPMPAQARLARALEERQFSPNRSELKVPLAARLFALTSADLEHALARRAFREDLYFSLNPPGLSVPPLRTRPGDIAPLARHFAALLTEVHHRPRLHIAPEALLALGAYSFPGNVRELRDIMERAVLHAQGASITPQDLPSHLRFASREGRKMSLQELESAYIAEVLEFTHGRKTMAAGILGISRKTLLEKRKRYGLR
ncbi:MAG TPA: sigma 54-interacting transcriptional regulator [Terriglobales bacterium]|nr:sigma 54-interacting transcriptional regulator [Terriglobales bacterium]